MHADRYVRKMGMDLLQVQYVGHSYIKNLKNENFNANGRNVISYMYVH
jgi:hypothetical protein